MSVCMSSVTLLHPAKAIGWNEIPFGRDTYVVPSNIVLDRGHSLTTGRGDLGVRTLNAESLWPLLTMTVCEDWS